MALGDFGIFLNGSYGVGKSSTLDHLGDCFAAANLAFSLFDVDWFHRSWPTASADPRNVLTEAENIRAVWQNYRRVGPRTPIIAGVISSLEDQDRYEQCFEMPLQIVHLTASAGVAEKRLRGRYAPTRQQALNWHLDDHQRLSRELQTGLFHDLVIDTDAMTAMEVAQLVFDTYVRELSSRSSPPSRAEQAAAIARASTRSDDVTPGE